MALKLESVDVPKYLPNNWRTIRKQYGYSIAKVAEDLLLEQNFLYLVEATKANFSGKTIIRSLKYYEIDFYTAYDVDNSLRVNENKELVELLKYKSNQTNDWRNIKHLRLLHDYSIQDLMEYLGLTYYSYLSLEAGTHNLTGHSMWLLSSLYKVPLEYIVNIDKLYEDKCKEKTKISKSRNRESSLILD